MNWVSVKDRLPEKHKKVLIWNARYNGPEISSLNESNRFEYSSYTYGEYNGEEEYKDGEITHWMDLPEAPK